MPILNSALAAIITRYRRAAGYSQEELAEHAEIHRTYVSQIERGIKSPTLPVLFRLASALNISVAELIGEVEKIINDLQNQ